MSESGRGPNEARLRFGSFVLDPLAGGLYRDGERIELQDLPLRLLAALVERPGTTISRRDLYARLWPDTVVDYERGLNTAMRKLRIALGDRADEPRYVETVPRRGYRFLAGVTAAEAPADPEARKADTPDPPPLPPPPSRSPLSFWLSAAVATLAVAALVTSFALWTDRGSAHDPRGCPDRTAQAPAGAGR